MTSILFYETFAMARSPYRRKEALHKCFIAIFFKDEKGNGKHAKACVIIR
jgi:hypothetical protein